jgi:UDP-glucose 6-dehydrogenase
MLANEGIEVCAFDPIVKDADEFLGQVANSVDECTVNANVLLVLTDWGHFTDLNPGEVLASMDTQYVFDTRRILDRKAWVAAGAKFHPGWA